MVSASGISVPASLEVVTLKTLMVRSASEAVRNVDGSLVWRLGMKIVCTELLEAVKDDGSSFVSRSNR